MFEHPIKVLLIDDQRIVGETIRRMFLDIPSLEYRFVSDPLTAIAEANAFQPTVILQDLIMPGVDGIEMVRHFRANPATSSTPLIVLSSKEEPVIKVEAFTAGANDYLVKLPDKLELLARIRYHSAAHIARLQRDEAFAALEAQQRLIAQEIADAAAYVRSLLPTPMLATSVIPSSWRFLTSTTLGGDSFGYHWLNDHELAIYLLDVCGHGVGSALLSVSAINTIKSGTLPHTDFHSPAQVLAALNRAFPMGERDGKYFTMWYGVLNAQTRELRYGSGGHPPAIAIAPDGTPTMLSTPGLMVGAMDAAPYTEALTTLAPGTRLYVFSDGCYELGPENAPMMKLTHFAEILARSTSLDEVIAAAQAFQHRPDFDDDFSLLEFKL